MADLIKRREFIKNASVFGASIAIANPVSAKTFLPTNDGDIKNDYFTISFDKKRGTINISRNSGTPLLTGGTVCANSNTDKYSIASGRYEHSLDTINFKDQLGGKRLLIFSKDLENKLNFEIQISLYDQLEAITIETVCKNVSKHDLVINSLEPIRVIKNEGGIFNVPGVSKCITNGEMYFDGGTIHEFGTVIMQFHPAI
jgi:hypothetical protein